MDKTICGIPAEQLRAILRRLEVLEVKAINVMKLIREPRFSPDLFDQFSDTVIRIQVKIREFRSDLSKSSSDFNYEHFLNFVEYATPTLQQSYDVANSHLKH